MVLTRMGAGLAALALGLALIAPQAARAEASAAEQEAAKAFIETLSAKAFEALRDPSLAGAAQRQRFRELLREGVALDFVGMFLLGRFRRDATPAQLADYDHILPEYIVGFYTDQILRIGDEKLEILSTQPAGKSDIYVRSRLVGPSGRPPIAADWRVRRVADGSFKIIDLKVEGVSIAATKREEFASLIASRGFDGLLAQLHADAAQPASAE
ncbi:MAG: MlaC/ttg2D family ABC transporter substrate-binding protein [Pseudomonadota bacterium]